MSQTNSEEQLSPQRLEQETRLTFGVEYEYLLAYVNRRGQDPHPYDSRPVTGRYWEDVIVITDSISQALETENIPSINEFLEEDLDKPENHAKWVLKVDASVSANRDEDPSGYLYHGCEIASPAYFHCDETISMARRVLITLRKNFRVRTNTSTGLHVHVGNQFSGFEFQILRRIMAICWTYERQWQLMHPIHRQHNGYACPIGYNDVFRLNSEATRLQHLDSILEQEDHDDLIDLLGSSSSSRGAFNILNLAIPFDYPKKRTIEFRHHEGTLDPDAVENWIRVCIKIIEMACHIKDDEALFAKLREDCMKEVGLGQGKVSTVEFLMWLKCPVQAYYYGKKIQQRGDAENIRILEAHAEANIRLPEGEHPEQEELPEEDSLLAFFS